MKLHLAELVRGMEERAAAQSESAASRRTISIRGLDLGARLDFSNAQRGEIPRMRGGRSARREVYV